MVMVVRRWPVMVLVEVQRLVMGMRVHVLRSAETMTLFSLVRSHSWGRPKAIVLVKAPAPRAAEESAIGKKPPN